MAPSLPSEFAGSHALDESLQWEQLWSKLWDEQPYITAWSAQPPSGSSGTLRSEAAATDRNAEELIRRFPLESLLRLSSAIGSQLERLPAVRVTGRSAEPQSRLLAASQQHHALRAAKHRCTLWEQMMTVQPL
ncbi:hypothetical protein CRENBAI_017242 [Crenichthys baileyi]|uniref:Uncharacterized protein n=1 Tax=Crenichthys baileyi TaxID=28760 RepID=A0AAV9QTL5_9TELE